ncbi:unnamed protein product [Camellia sinensis]
MLDNVVIGIQPNPSQPSSVRNRDPRPIDNNPLLRKICKGKGSILSPESPCASCWSPVKVKRVAGNAPQKPVECPADESAQSHLCPKYMRYGFDSASRRPFDEKILYCVKLLRPYLAIMATFHSVLKLEGNPKEDPLLLWYSGGPGCSTLNGLFHEIDL